MGGDKGVIIRPVAGGAVIIAPVDANGELRISGLSAGEYEVAPLRLTAAAPVRHTEIRVGDDGRLALALVETSKRTLSVEAIAVDGAKGIVPVNAVLFDLRKSFAVAFPPPCDPLPGRPDTCDRMPKRNHIDVNVSSAADIVRVAPATSVSAAAMIVAEREKAGPYTSIEDFARRNCPSNAIDFGQAPVRIGEILMILNAPATADGSVSGFQCSPGAREQFSLYGKKYNYVGHVTLLR